MLLAACQRDEPLFVAKTYVVEPPPVGLAENSLIQATNASLTHSGFVIGAGSRRNYAAKVALYRDTAMVSGQVVEKWRLRVALSPTESTGDALPLEGVGDVIADEAVPRADELRTVAEEAAREMADERKLLRKPASDVEAALSSSSREVRDFAIRLAGQRKLRTLVPVLCQRLNDEPEPDLVLRVVGALVQIGDARAVGPLAELTKRRHPVFVNQIVFAVAQIGGPEAEAYLDTLANGHPSDQVREAAKEALSELLARKSAVTR
jgi:hypothetical protein